MGIIICEKHGRQGLVHVCDHVRQDILTGISTIDCVITGEEVFGAIANEPLAVHMAYCDVCAKRYELRLVDEALSDSPTEFGNVAKPVCSECFKLLKESLRL